MQGMAADDVARLADLDRQQDSKLVRLKWGVGGEGGGCLSRRPAQPSDDVLDVVDELLFLGLRVGVVEAQDAVPAVLGRAPEVHEARLPSPRGAIDGCYTHDMAATILHDAAQALAAWRQS